MLIESSFSLYMNKKDFSLLEQDGGQCSCKDHVTSRDCGACQDGYYNLQAANPVGCEPCNCYTAGTFNGDIRCHPTDGQCNCKANVRSKFFTHT